MLNIVIPMAGAGSRFVSANYKVPKPLILINDIPMIRLVIENLRPQIEHRFIFICQQAHIDIYGLNEKLSAWAPGCKIIGLDGITDGAARTVLYAENLINNSMPLMIANSDQYVDININTYLKYMNDQNFNGLIMTMKADDPKWSFVDVDINGMVTQVVEKKVISDEATVGIYNFRHGKDFVEAAKKMIFKNQRVNEEFYVAPAYSQLIALGAKVGFYNIGDVASGMYGLGTPADLELFLDHPICARVTGQI
jgi:NDP-sugar pyrophosphorylase family protein